MKKAISLILVLMLAFAVSATALADNPTGGSTNLTYTVGEVYTISIPDAVVITRGTGTQTVGVNVNSVIPADKVLTFKITAATNYDTENNKFRLINGSNANVFLEYSIKNGEDPIAMNAAFLTASPTECYAGKTVTLSYTTGTAESAGTYSDSLTFTVGLA